MEGLNQIPGLIHCEIHPGQKIEFVCTKKDCSIKKILACETCFYNEGQYHFGHQFVPLKRSLEMILQDQDKSEVIKISLNGEIDYIKEKIEDQKRQIIKNINTYVESITFQLEKLKHKENNSQVGYQLLDNLNNNRSEENYQNVVKFIKSNQRYLKIHKYSRKESGIQQYIAYQKKQQLQNELNNLQNIFQNTSQELDNFSQKIYSSIETTMEKVPLTDLINKEQFEDTQELQVFLQENHPKYIKQENFRIINPIYQNYSSTVYNAQIQNVQVSIFKNNYWVLKY